MTEDDQTSVSKCVMEAIDRALARADAGSEKRKPPKQRQKMAQEAPPDGWNFAVLTETGRLFVTAPYPEFAGPDLNAYLHACDNYSMPNVFETH